MEHWQPANPDHAIAIMGAVVTFNGNLTDVALNRILTSSRQAARSAQLDLDSPIREFALNADGQSAVGRPVGSTFSSTEPPPKVSGVAIDFSEELHVEQRQLMYRTARYSSWSSARDKIVALLGPALEIASNLVGISTIRLEYLDRFVSIPGASIPELNTLLKSDCGFLAPHAFERQGSWHSHSGYSEDASATARMITQVHIDSALSKDQRQRGVSIMSAQELRKPFADNGDEYAPADVFRHLEGMHDQLLDIMRKLLVTQIAEEIGL